MSQIPVIDLQTLHQRLNGGTSDRKFILHEFTSQHPPRWAACRMEVFFIALLHQGELIVESDLITQSVRAPALFAMGPSVIRKFVQGSDDFRSEVLFFDKAFFLEQLSNIAYLDKYDFFYQQHDHLLSLSKQEHRNFMLYFELIKKQMEKPGLYAGKIIRNFLHILLLEIAEIHIPKEDLRAYTHNQVMVTAFRKHLDGYYQTQKKVGFYASLQYVSSKYFSSIIQVEMGKTAGEIIDEKVVLEAKVLLQNKAMTIAQVSGLLGFNDPSNFSKYFKNLTGHSPLSYRNQANI